MWVAVPNVQNITPSLASHQIPPTTKLPILLENKTIDHKGKGLSKSFLLEKGGGPQQRRKNFASGAKRVGLIQIGLCIMHSVQHPSIL